jgi:hypothetical protein
MLTLLCLCCLATYPLACIAQIEILIVSCLCSTWIEVLIGIIPIDSILKVFSWISQSGILPMITDVLLPIFTQSIDKITPLIPILWASCGVMAMVAELPLLIIIPPPVSCILLPPTEVITGLLGIGLPVVSTVIMLLQRVVGGKTPA